MGVAGLYKVLEEIASPMELRNLSKFGEGKLRVAMDGNVWVAKACHIFSVSLVVEESSLSNFGRYRMSLVSEQQQQQNKEERSMEVKIQEYVSECTQWLLDQIHRLMDYDTMDILVVFDGKTPPLKEACSRQRQEKRAQAASTHRMTTTTTEEENRIDDLDARIQMAKRSGGTVYVEDDNDNQTLLSTFSLVMSSLMDLLQSKHIPFLVAPYEADSQLIFLSQQGYVDVVLTEDSDLYLTCPLIFTKYQTQSGTVQLLRQMDLGSCTNCNLMDSSSLMLLLMMIAAGCDYCPSLKGIGFLTASKIIQSAYHHHHQTTTSDEEVALLPLIFQELYTKSTNNTSLSSSTDKYNYETQFMKAIILFRHAIVFCPIQKKCIIMNHPTNHTNPHDPDHKLLCQYPPYQELFDKHLSEIVGTMIDSETAISIATGNRDPKTNEPYPHANIHPISSSASSSTDKNNSSNNNNNNNNNYNSVIGDEVNLDPTNTMSQSSASSHGFHSQPNSSSFSTSVSPDVKSPSLLGSPPISSNMNSPKLSQSSTESTTTHMKNHHSQ